MTLELSVALNIFRMIGAKKEGVRNKIIFIKNASFNGFHYSICFFEKSDLFFLELYHIIYK